MNSIIHTNSKQLLQHRIYAIINISGLVLALLVAVLIGFLIADEMSRNHAGKNEHNIVWQTQREPTKHEVKIQQAHPVALTEKFRLNFGKKFQLVVTEGNDDDVLQKTQLLTN